jgi:hypothetical protein
VSELDRGRLAAVLGMTGSAGDGEALNAARMANRMVREVGTTWPAVLQVDEIDRLLSINAALAAENTRLKDALMQAAAASSDAPRICACHQCRATRCLEKADRLRPKERGFCASMRRQEYPPSAKQAAWLDAICERLGVDP